MIRDLDEALETLPFGRLRVLVLVLVTSIIVLDGFDIQLAALAAPAMLAEWGLDRVAFGPVLAASLAGMAAGTALGGSIGDRIGRRPALIGSVLFFAAMTALSALADDPMTLGLLRLATGLGLGAAVPNATALVAEWMPRRWRAYAVTLVIVAVPIGGMLGAALCAWMIPTFGWRACFILGGVAPALLALIMIITLPESPQFLGLRDDRSNHLRHLMNRLAGDNCFDSAMIFRVSAPTPGMGGVAELLSAPLRVTTWQLWAGFFAAMLALYGCLNWLPVLLSGLGLPMDQAVRGSMWFNLGGVAGAVMGAWAGGRFGTARCLSALCLIGACILSIAAIALALGHIPGVTAAMVPVLLSGGAILGVQVGLYGLAAARYPTSCRAAGIGWAATLGRGGAVVSALAGGWVLAQPLGAALWLGVLTLALLFCWRAVRTV
jgi:AAHS family 4-hydroxybenzoate transporter-like MFS transporter